MIKPSQFLNFYNRNYFQFDSLKLKIMFKFSTDNQRNKDSKWIYSSKYDEMQSMKKGKIYVTTDTGNDCHDVTLRMYKALMKDPFVVFSYNPHQTTMQFKSLSQKDRFVSPELHNPKQQQFGQNIQSAKQMIPRQGKSSSIIKNDLSQLQKKSFQDTIQVGKYVDMEIDMQSIMKKGNDPGNKHLYQRQKQLKKYLKNRQFRTQLQNLKQQQGHPQVLPILQDKQDIKYFYDNGINVTYVLHEYQIKESNRLFSNLEQLGLPYEILPCKNQLINTIVSSGFPADRFSIQYFPQDLQQILMRRKKAKLTVAMIIKRQQLQNTIQSISTIYGKQHLVFLQNQPNPFRSQIHNFYDYLKLNPIKQSVSEIKIIVSPFIAQFNQSILQQQHKIRHLYGEAQSQKTNFIQLQLLGQKLHKLRKKQNTHQVDIYNMAAQMISKIKNPQIVKQALRNMLSLNQKQAQYLFTEGQKRIKIDYLGIKEFQTFVNKKI